MIVYRGPDVESNKRKRAVKNPIRFNAVTVAFSFSLQIQQPSETDHSRVATECQGDVERISHFGRTDAKRCFTRWRDEFFLNGTAQEQTIESAWKAFMPTAQWLPEYGL